MANARFFLTTAGLMSFLSVALGAFGAHFLKTRLDEYHLGVFKTGVEYQLYHALALGLVGVLLLRPEYGALKSSGVAFLVGTVIFSGSLYLLAFTGVKAWGAVTPLGGVTFLIGWALLTWNVAQAK
jgi:uncharacterized membrane protein YgdD (TMEM256/DUF423 family)